MNITPTVENPSDGDQRSPGIHDPDKQEPQGPRRRIWRILLWVAVALAALVAATIAVLYFGRDKAEELTQDDALADFRDAAEGSVETDGLPSAGVYAATASGTESIGLPGFDEPLGPSAPVTVTTDIQGCFTYKADFNSHHWRSWKFCPTDTATFALVGLESWTARKAPALDIETLSTYVCDTPLDLLWNDMTAGQNRAGACTGTTDTGTTDSDDSVTDDAGEVKVLSVAEQVTIGGQTLDAIRIQVTDNLSGDQSGSEVGTWWLDPATGLPLRLSTESSLSGGLSDYSEQIDLELDTLTPAT